MAGQTPSNFGGRGLGSSLPAVGTTLPETSIPIIAIFFRWAEERTEAGLGAILGGALYVEHPGTSDSCHAADALCQAGGSGRRISN